MRIDDLRDTLQREADVLGGTEPLGVHARADAVAERARAGAARRRVARGAALVVAGGLVVTGVADVYSYWRGEQVDQDREILRVAVAPTRDRQVIGWATSRGTPGQVVVSVDGTVVHRGKAGSFEYGVPLTREQTHLVVVRVTRPQPGRRIGLAIYGPETF